MKQLSTTYDPAKTESRIYKLWEKSGFFNPDKLPARHKKPYTIVLPPPNVTGALHMGHTLNALIQDALIRWQRMKGRKTLWLPGTDHAGIATQNVVEKMLKKEGKSRHDLGREKFEKRVWQWKEEYGDVILDQLKRLGASADWSRTRFTMDKEYVAAVGEAFIHYHKKGWVYQAYRVINWCPRCGTTLSDLELEYEEEKGTLWYIKYPLKDEDGHITVATTRPETMLGDAAVAVNPKDPRYKKLIGKTVMLPIMNREIPVIADHDVDPKFGTGAVKVTPLHSTADWTIAQRHKLKEYLIIDERRKMTKEAGPICDGLNVKECREVLLKELKKQGLLEKEEEIVHQVPHCYRCNSVVEPLPKMQWFLAMSDLAKKALAPVKKKEVQFVPPRWSKPYTARLEQERDWNISRQLWWGHKLPVWYHDPICIPKPGKEKDVSKCIDIQVSIKEPKCKFCLAKYKQSEEVLDTWFSAALWPFATLGWPLDMARGKPKKGSDLDTFFPTQTLSTGHDIISIWVARMIFSSQEFMGKNPYEKVVIHATVLAKDGRRMSKSLGTGVDPLKLIDQYGADATRFGLAYQSMGNQDMKFAEEHMVMGKKFCNKLWNATRYILMQDPPMLSSPAKSSSILKYANSTADKKIVNELLHVQKKVDKHFEAFEFGHAAHLLSDFFWHTFADVYIEKTKTQMNASVLLLVHLQTLKLLHPLIPFITEELYGHLPIKNAKSLMIETWPHD